MKKLLVLVLLVPILALTMISCDADMRSNLAGWMGGFNGNVYADAGFIVPNTAQAEAAAATIAAIGTGLKGSETVTPGTTKKTQLGLEVTIPADVTKMLAPQDPKDQETLKNQLADALNSKQQKDKLLKDLTKIVTDEEQIAAAIGTAKVFNETLKELGNQLGGSSDLGEALQKLKLPDLGDGAGLTQGDLLTLQMMTNLVSNTVTKLNEISGDKLNTVDGDMLSDNQDDILAIVGEALFVADVAEQISGADSLNIFAQIDFQGLMDGFGNKGTSSRSIPLSDAEVFIDIMNPMSASIITMMGVTKGGSEYVYSPEKYRSFLINQRTYRSVIEQALMLMKLGNLSNHDNAPILGSSTIVKYALAVFFTEHDDYWTGWKIGKSSDVITPNAIIAQYLNANKRLASGNLSVDDELLEPSFADNFNYDGWTEFMTTSPDRIKDTDEGRAYYKTILKNIILINEAGGFDLLHQPMDDFLNGTGEFEGEGFDKVYQDLIDDLVE